MTTKGQSQDGCRVEPITVLPTRGLVRDKEGVGGVGFKIWQVWCSGCVIDTITVLYLIKSMCVYHELSVKSVYEEQFE